MMRNDTHEFCTLEKELHEMGTYDSVEDGIFIIYCFLGLKTPSGEKIIQYEVLEKIFTPILSERLLPSGEVEGLSDAELYGIIEDNFQTDKGSKDSNWPHTIKQR